MTKHLELSILRQELDRLRYWNNGSKSTERKMDQIEKRIEKLEKEVTQ